MAPLYIIPDNQGIADILANKLQQAQIDSLVSKYPPPTAKSIICLSGLNKFDSQPLDSIEINYELFKVARNYSKNIGQAQGIFILAHTTIDNPWQGGITALAKTAAQEWPKVTVKAIDIDCRQFTSEQIAESLFEEVIAGGRDLEIMWNPKGRFVVDISEFIEESQKIPLVKNSVVLVSGGARGVTAECLLALVKQVDDLKIAIIGRTELIEEAEIFVDCRSERQLKAALIKKYKEDLKSVIPRDIQLEVNGILARREVQKNIIELKEKSEILYFTADIKNLPQVQQVVDKVHRQWGNIDTVIHAAGIIHDKLIRDKEFEQFFRVFNTKVIGLQNLLETTREDTLSHLCCFSSVAGCMGNIGQVDYAMANEVLNKVCQQQKNIRNNCVVKSINWGPWQGGMVSPELFSHFTDRGIPLIPLKEGARFFVEEITRLNPVEIIYTGSSTLANDRVRYE